MVRKKDSQKGRNSTLLVLITCLCKFNSVPSVKYDDADEERTEDKVLLYLR